MTLTQFAGVSVMAPMALVKKKTSQKILDATWVFPSSRNAMEVT
jgi:hypothetical protein